MEKERQFALVTGAAKRVGRCIAMALAEDGYSIVVHCNTSRQEADALVSQLPGEGHFVLSADLAGAHAPEAMFAALRQRGVEHLAVLVNNASCYQRRPLGEETPDELLGELQVNFLAPFELMRRYHEQYGAGQIVNLLDYRVAMPDSASGGYALAKKSLKDATEACALEWAPHFRVNGIAPGLVRPADGVPMEHMNRLLATVPTGKRTEETDIVAALRFIISTPSINGSVIYLDGGLHLLGANATGEKRLSGETTP